MTQTGRSSVHQELSLFANDAALAAALGRFVHAMRRPVLLPPALLAALQALRLAA